jgi:hypothetical protein
MEKEMFSRPARLGAFITGESEEAVIHLFTEKRILVRLEAPFCEVADARETFIFAVNQCLRFCSNISVCVEGGSDALVMACDSLAVQVHGPGATVEAVKNVTGRVFDAIVNVGTEVLSDLPSATVNSTAWVARLATTGSGNPKLYWKPETPNPLGALAASCMGVGSAFLTILGRPPAVSMETSLFSHEVANPGTLAPGPPLPTSPLQLNGFLVGCGAVTNGWAYAMKRLPVVGRLQAIDRQSLRSENVGSYVAVGLESVNKPKALLIKELLAPAIDVTERPDQWEFFKIWLDHGLEVPPLIITGLDNVTTRHSVQRLWPETLIDMAAEGLQSQVIVKHKKGDGLCLLRALSIPPGEVDWAQNLARATGLDPTLIVKEPTGEITQAEIEAAPVDKQPELRTALGKPRCGHINRQSLQMEGYDADFAPAVPFVTGFSGVVGAAETMNWLMGRRHPDSLHFQKSFESSRSRALEMKCDPSCECQSLVPQLTVSRSAV